jgi:hypothetical protein
MPRTGSREMNPCTNQVNRVFLTLIPEHGLVSYLQEILSMVGLRIRHPARVLLSSRWTQP